MRWFSLAKLFTLQNSLRFLGIFLILWVIGTGIVWLVFLRGIPVIESLERGDYFKESTVIYDKDKSPIYTLYTNGKRTYAKYNDISESIKNAIVSTEDKTFFENPGIDIKWLIRAGINYISGKTDRIKGTSTLSQQLISYTLLSKERSVKRKVQEAYLSYALNNNYSKEKILEMYLNAISFGYNADGIEEASKTYFWKSAKDVWPLGASILASLPKWPTYYSPYLHRDRIMGNVYVYPVSDPTSAISLDTATTKNQYKSLYNNFRTYLSGITITNDNNSIGICGINKLYTRDSKFSPNSEGCIKISQDDLLPFFGDIIIRENVTASGTNANYALEYTIGRKDFVASRMLEDGKIDGNIFKNVVYDGLEFTFKKYSENIRYPYFVMYIKEYLESRYWKDIDVTAGLKVYTTIDPKLQDKAEELVKKQVAINKVQYGATSAALVSMDNKSGWILSMVWWPDYFDIDNGGNNNMIIAKRQPWSSFKPIVYALAISKYPIGPESPVADVKTVFWKYIPNDYDNTFKGIMPLRKALAWSRNIPAVKMFYLAGKEAEVVKFGKSIGLTTLKEDAWYWAPLAIGSAEVRPIDLMQAYSVLANEWIKRDVYSVEKIEDSDGNILEEHKIVESSPIFSPAAAYVTTKIISDADSRPEGFWRNALTVSGRNFAAKTGTSNKEIGPDKILPRDLWTAWYSPQITTVVWAGNVSGKETKWTCDGLNCAAGIWKPYMEFAHKDLPKEDWKKPDGVYSYVIAKASGKLATAETPDEQKITTITAVKLTEYDNGLKEEKVDTLCNGPLSENTPPWAIGTIFIPSASPIIDGYDPTWTTGFFDAVNMISSGSGTTSILTRSSKPCERPGGPGNISISVNIVWINSDNTTEGKKIIEASWIGDRPIRKITIKYKNEEKLSNSYESWSKLTGSARTNIDLKNGDHTFIVEVIDMFGFSYTESRTITIGWISNSGEKPTLSLINPKETNPRINLYSGDNFNLRFSIKVGTSAREIAIFMDDKSIQNASAWELFVIPITSSWLSVWSHTLRIQVLDGNMNKVEKSVQFNILPR